MLHPLLDTFKAIFVVALFGTSSLLHLRFQANSTPLYSSWRSGDRSFLPRSRFPRSSMHRCFLLLHRRVIHSSFSYNNLIIDTFNIRVLKNPWFFFFQYLNWGRRLSFLRSNINFWKRLFWLLFYLGRDRFRLWDRGCLPNIHDRPHGEKGHGFVSKKVIAHWVGQMHFIALLSYLL